MQYRLDHGDIGAHLILSLPYPIIHDSCNSFMAHSQLFCPWSPSSNADHVHTSAGMSPREALHLAIKGGAKNLGRDDIGMIAPGMAADFVAWRTDTFAFAGAQHDLVAALILCTPSIGTVYASVINGRVCVRDGQLQTADLDQIVHDLNLASARLMHHHTPHNLSSGSSRGTD